MPRKWQHLSMFVSIPQKHFSSPVWECWEVQVHLYITLMRARFYLCGNCIEFKLGEFCINCSMSVDEGNSRTTRVAYCVNCAFLR